jgi:hypothetical protein
MRVNANPWAMALGAVLLASPAAWASEAVQHTGTVTAVDAIRNTVTIEEMGPWHPGRMNLKHEVFAMTPETRVELASRTDVAGGYRGRWAEQRLPVSDLRAGDYATVTAEREAGKLQASQVVVVRPGEFEPHAGAHPARAKSHI